MIKKFLQSVKCLLRFHPDKTIKSYHGFTGYDEGIKLPMVRCDIRCDSCNRLLESFVGIDWGVDFKRDFEAYLFKSFRDR